MLDVIGKKEMVETIHFTLGKLMTQTMIKMYPFLRIIWQIAMHEIFDKCVR